MTRILFVRNNPATFIQTDLELLRDAYPVTELFITPARLFRIWQIFRLVQAHDLVFGWFAAWHTLLPVIFAHLLNKPSIVVVGGYDTANLPQAGYGSQRGGVRRLFSRMVFRTATHLITFSHSARQEAISEAKIPAEKISLIYPGFPPTHESPTGDRSLIMTVGKVWQENLLRKGLLPFVQAAALLPEHSFVLVGGWHDDAIHYLKKIAPPNVIFTGYVPDETLQKYYNLAGVYVQASLHEGFGLSVAEAMLAGCVPLVSRKGALPEVVGEAGVYLVDTSPEAIAAGIQEALLLDETARHAARTRILTHFPLSRRREELAQLVEELTKPPGDLTNSSL